MVITSAIEKSMWSPCPVRCARRAAAATAIAENVPANHSLVRPPAWNGTLRTEPRPTRPPDSACTMNSVVGRSAYGPVRPYGVIEHTTSPGCASSQRLHVELGRARKLSMHDVGAGDERLDLRIARATDDRAHPVVQELEQRAAVVGVDRPRRPPTTRATGHRPAARP